MSTVVLSLEATQRSGACGFEPVEDWPCSVASTDATLTPAEDDTGAGGDARALASFMSLRKKA